MSQLVQLETLSRRLETSDAEWCELEAKVLDYAHQFIRNSSPGSSYYNGSPSGSGLLSSPITEDGISIEDALSLLHENVSTVGINPSSSRMFGYIPGGNLTLAAFGDFLAAIINKYSGLFFSAPGAVTMENMLLRWMSDAVGYPETAGGYLSSGGSLANLSAVITAREAHDIRPRDISRTVVYLTPHTHHCVVKALRIAGMAECVYRTVEVDNDYRMSVAALQKAVRKDFLDGLNPWLVVASAGTTDTGTVDPLRDIRHVADRHGLWFHVDGAYGAFFALCPEGAAILDGLGTSDSLVLDPHKTLFVPYGTGALLVRNQTTLGDAHGGFGAYMQDMIAHPTEVSPAYLSPELTRHFRALRIWLPLKVLGLEPFRAALSEKIHLARYFHEQIQKVQGFEVGPYPDLSIATYRYVPRYGDADVFNLELAQRLQQDGRIFVTSTRLQGTVVLRMAVLNFRTHRDDVDAALDLLQHFSRTLDRKISHPIPLSSAEGP